MTQLQQQVLVWVILGFFSIIGILSLLVKVRLLNADDDFRQWALRGFIIGTFGTTLGLFKIYGDPSYRQLNDPIVVGIIPAGFDEKGLRKFQIREAWLWETQELLDQKPGATTPVLEPKKRWLKRSPPNAGQLWEVEIPLDALGSLGRLKVKDDNDIWWESMEFRTNRIGNMLMEQEKLPHNQSVGLLSTAWAAEEIVKPKSSSSTGVTHPKFNNYARAIDKIDGRQYYEWRVFVDEPDHILSAIRDVRYVLHPTFPNPIQVKCDPSNRFSLHSSGWGEFRISVTIRYKDQREENVMYYLDLKKPWLDERTKEPKDERAC